MCVYVNVCVYAADTVEATYGIKTFFPESVAVGSFYFNAYFKMCNVNEPCKLQEGVEYDNLKKKYMVLFRALIASGRYPRYMSCCVRCRVLQGVAGCCRVLQGVAGLCALDCLGEIPQVYVLLCVLQGVAGCCSVLQCVVRCCSLVCADCLGDVSQVYVLLCPPGCCSVLQGVAVCCSFIVRADCLGKVSQVCVLECAARCCSVV